MRNPPADTLRHEPAELWLRRLMINHNEGRARFPLAMGLPEEEYRRLARRLLPGLRPRPELLRRQDQLLSALQRPRRQEREALAQWLRQYLIADGAPLHLPIAAAAMGFNHLWQDLGLASRGELRQLMGACFPALIAMNAQNMRWKKFFYRQLCLAQTGEINCRSPSCDSCCEREICFTADD
ncbi:nitrogen fixation protein NifQ [Sodalis sp. RH21]|uniref:nitrogen fixation protein NifQ n=1 Tax=unclassified Sodalis (in: enterobacteria) TaxID=2636512 RepID=UPI0039B6AB13